MLASIVMGILLIAAGLVMLVVPGPGTLVLAIGVGLILAQFAWGQRLIARLRVWLRDRFGSPVVRRFEERAPRRIFPPAETQELRKQSARRRNDDDSSAGLERRRPAS